MTYGQSERDKEDSKVFRLSYRHRVITGKKQIDKTLLKAGSPKLNINMVEARTKCCPPELHGQVTRFLLKIQNNGHKTLFDYENYKSLLDFITIHMQYLRASGFRSMTRFKRIKTATTDLEKYKF